MTATCGSVTIEELVAYWAHDLAAEGIERIDEHVIGCHTCWAASARIAVIAESMATLIPPFLTPSALGSLRARGHRIRENPIQPDERRLVVFDAATDVLVHKLAGLDLATATNVAVVVSVEETGDVLLDEPSVPFDRASGEVLVACQPHFAELPPNIVAEVRVRDAAGSERLARYAIPHLYEAR